MSSGRKCSQGSGSSWQCNLECGKLCWDRIPFGQRGARRSLSRSVIVFPNSAFPVYRRGQEPNDAATRTLDPSVFDARTCACPPAIQLRCLALAREEPSSGHSIPVRLRARPARVREALPTNLPVAYKTSGTCWRFTLPVCDMVRRRMRNIADLATSIIGQWERYDRLKPISRTYAEPSASGDLESNRCNDHHRARRGASRARRCGVEVAKAGGVDQLLSASDFHVFPNGAFRSCPPAMTC